VLGWILHANKFERSDLMKQSRWTSWAAWLTLLPVILLIGDTYGLWEVINMPGDIFTKVFTGIGAVLVAFGIFNNPENKTGF
jgi:uncharacterized membrane protein